MIVLGVPHTPLTRTFYYADGSKEIELSPNNSGLMHHFKGTYTEIFTPPYSDLGHHKIAVEQVYMCFGLFQVFSPFVER